MSRIKGLTVLCCVVLCSRITCAGQTVMGIDELFRLADENSTSIRSYETGAESADEALKAAKAQRLPEIGISLAQEHVKTAVEAGYVDFMTSFSDLRTQEKSVELADQNYAVVKNRYENDLALLTDMLDASNMKLSADLALENARINVVYSYYKMKYLSHTL